MTAQGFRCAPSPRLGRVGVRGIQNYRETLTPHPSPLPAEVGSIRLRPTCSRSIHWAHHGDWTISERSIRRGYGTHALASRRPREAARSPLIAPAPASSGAGRFITAAGREW
jgi:hypothetical protein